MLNQLELEELRAFCQCPARRHLSDLLAVGLAGFFGFDALRRVGKPGEAVWALTSVTLAVWIAWIHGRRYYDGSELGRRWEQI